MSDHELTQPYYDGELSPEKEAAALRHLSGCAQCQRDLAEWMALDSAGDGAAPRQVAPPRPRRWWIAVPVLAAAAAAALVWWTTRDADRGGPPPAIALADRRAVEIRVASAELDRHRPLRVERGGAAGEAIPMAVLAKLEHDDLLGYQGALLLGGDLERARAAIERQPSSIARDTDLSGLRVLAGDPVGAIEAADRALAAGPSPAARWNRALALRDLGLVRTAAAELDAIAAAGEPGWSDEARALAGGLRAPIVERDRALAAFEQAEGTMLAGGAAIDPALAARFPGQARVDLHDALRVAPSADAARALVPLAEAIDRASGGDGARRAVGRVAASDFTVRGRFVERYRALVLGSLDAAKVPSLLAELEKAGPAVADLRFGAIVLSGTSAQHGAALDAIAAADGDPWFTVYVARERARRQRAAGDLAGAEVTLRATVASCPREVAYRCGAVALDLAMLYIETLQLGEAATWAARARAEYIASGTPYQEEVALAHLGDIERLRARFGPMRAYLDEYAAARPDDCVRRSFVAQENATAAYWQGDLATARARLPEPGACDAPPSPPYVMVAVDVARFTGERGDLDRAQAAIEALAAAGGDESRMIVAAARGRLEIVRSPDTGRQILGEAIAAAASLPAATANPGEFRAWAYASLIGDAAARGDAARALADFLDERGGFDPGGCLLAVSLDDDRRATLVRGADGALHVSAGRTASILRAAAAELVPDDARAALAGCPSVHVIARPPLHGRGDLLPAATAWSFASTGPTSTGGASSGEAVIVRDAAPPADLRLPRVGARAIERAGDRVITGAEATPSRVLTALGSAAYVELHVHGLVDLGRTEASFLALSPEPDGRFALTAADLARTRLAGAPIVVLAACRSAEVAPLVNRRWSLPDALLGAGARAVIAVGAPIPDDQAAAFFTSLRARLAAGASPAAAVALERTAGSEPWRAQVMVFE